MASYEVDTYSLPDGTLKEDQISLDSSLEVGGQLITGDTLFAAMTKPRPLLLPATAT